MEFAEVPWGILLMLPSRSVTLPAKATLVALTNFRDEPIVCLVRLKTTPEVHLGNLFAFENTKESPCGYTILENRYDPVHCEGTASSLPAEFLEFEGIGLERGCRLLPRSILAHSLRHWSIMWKAWPGKYYRTRSWRPGDMKRCVEWCIMIDI